MWAPGIGDRPETTPILEAPMDRCAGIGGIPAWKGWSLEKKSVNVALVEKKNGARMR